MSRQPCQSLLGSGLPGCEPSALPVALGLWAASLLDGSLSTSVLGTCPPSLHSSQNAHIFALSLRPSPSSSASLPRPPTAAQPLHCSPGWSRTGLSCHHAFALLLAPRPLPTWPVGQLSRLSSGPFPTGTALYASLSCSHSQYREAPLTALHSLPEMSCVCASPLQLWKSLKGRK